MFQALGRLALGQAPLVPSIDPNHLHADGDVSEDGWTDETGGTTAIYQSIDEPDFDDADYVQSPPIDADDSATLTVRLLQGTTQIVAWSYADVPTTFTDAEHILTAPQAAAITDFTDLFVEFDDSKGSVYRFSLEDPPDDLNQPFRVRYRYCRMIST